MTVMNWSSIRLASTIFNDKTLLDDSYSVPHTTQLHVIERFKLIDDGKRSR
jgi:hypothetical protein